MINGTIPVNERKFNIRGAVTDGLAYLLKSIAIGLDKMELNIPAISNIV